MKYDILAADFDRNFHAILGYVFKNLNLSPFLCGLVQDIFHQIIHFGYICFEAFEFALVLSSLFLALKLKIKIEYFGSILNIGLMQEILASKLALPWKIYKL